MSRVRQVISCGFVGAALVLSAAACSVGPVELAGFDSKAPSPKPTAAPKTPSGSPSLGASGGPSLSGPAEKRSCADLTFSSQFRRLFQGGAKFAPPKREKVSGQGYEVACRIGPEVGQPGSLGFVEFKYVSDSKSKCEKEGLKADPTDAAGWYSEGKAEWGYTLCTASGNTSVRYHQGTDSKPSNLQTVSRLAHLVADGSWEIDAVLGQ